MGVVSCESTKKNENLYDKNTLQLGTVSKRALPFPILDAWVEQGEQDIRKKHGDHYRGGDDKEVCHEEVHVLLEHSLDHQEADAGVCENRFEHYRAAEQAGDLHASPGDKGVKRVAKGVDKKDAAFGYSPRAQADDVRLPDLIQHERPCHAQACADAND